MVIEDIERINFEKYGSHDKKMADWDFTLEEDYALARHKYKYLWFWEFAFACNFYIFRYAVKKAFLLCYLNVPCFNVPELVIGAEDEDAARKIKESVCI